MKAMVHTEYGPPTVLHLKDVAKPAPADDQVLVKIHAASVNFGDRAMVKGQPFLIRLMGYGLLKPKHAIPGGDIAGCVEAVGSKVTRFRPGDEVFGDTSEGGSGAYAEYVAAPEGALISKSANVSFEAAASVCEAAVVALQGLRDRGELQAGQKVLINGASGGIGTFAVQIAKALGAEVTGVCSTRNLDLVRSLGADHVIDYTKDDFTQTGQCYDLIFDIVANRSPLVCARSLTPGGIYVACAFSAGALFLGPVLSLLKGKKIRSLVAKSNTQDLIVVQELLEAGKVVPVIDRSYPLGELPEALQYLDSGNPTGKVVITMAAGGV